MTKFIVRQCELKGIRSDRSISAFVSARKNCCTSNTLGIDVEKLIEERSEEITKKMVSTVDRRTFWYVTSSKEVMEEAVANWGVKSEEIVFINRDNKLDTATVNQTQSFFHVRGMSRREGGAERYTLVSSTIACACDLCLNGCFDNCGYLADRGNVKRHSLRKVGKGNWE